MSDDSDNWDRMSGSSDDDGDSSEENNDEENNDEENNDEENNDEENNDEENNDEENNDGENNGGDGDDAGRQRANRNRARAAFYTAGAAGAVMLAPGILIGAFLPLLGFASSGVAAASFAAGWQASIGNVAAQSLFAMLQSAAAGGYGLAIVSTVVSAVAGGAAAIAAAVGSWLTWFWRDR